MRVAIIVLLMATLVGGAMFGIGSGIDYLVRKDCFEKGRIHQRVVTYSFPSGCMMEAKQGEIVPMWW